MVVDVTNTYCNIYSEKDIYYNIWLLMLQIHIVIDIREKDIYYNIWLLMLRVHIVSLFM